MDFADLVADAYKEPGRSEVLRLIPQLPSEESNQFLQELFRRGDHDLQRRSPFHLLACAGLELVAQPPIALQMACTERLQQLIPPHSVKDVRSLAKAGKLAIQPLTRYLLSEHRLTLPPPIDWPLLSSAFLCLRALMYIGGDEGLDALENLIQQGLGLIFEGGALIEGWRHFDQEAYARRIVLPLSQGWTQMSFNDKPMTSIRTLAGFEHFTHITTLLLGQCFKLKNINALSTLTQLERLEIIGCHSLKTITALGNLLNLKHLYLNGCQCISDFTPIGKATKLESLMMFGCRELTNLNWLRSLQRLENLSLLECIHLQSFEGITELLHLKHLSLTEVRTLRDTEILAPLRTLENLSLGGCRYLQDISALSALSNLKYLDLHDCTALRSIHALAQMPQLEIVHLERCYQLSEEDLATLPTTITIIKDSSTQ